MMSDNGDDDCDVTNREADLSLYSTFKALCNEIIQDSSSILATSNDNGRFLDKLDLLLVEIYNKHFFNFLKL